MAKKKHKRVGNYADFYIDSRMINGLERFGRDVPAILDKAVRLGGVPIEKSIVGFMRKHEFTGQTLRAYHKGKVEWKGSFMSYGFGWLTDDGGLPALFLEIGTPKQKPYFFNYYAVRNNEDEFNRIINDYVSRAFLGVME